MVCQTQYGTRSFELGQDVEVSDNEGAAIMASPFGICFERSAVSKAQAENVSPEAQAEIEATKMAKNYSNKKV